MALHVLPPRLLTSHPLAHQGFPKNSNPWGSPVSLADCSIIFFWGGGVLKTPSGTQKPPLGHMHQA